MIPSWFAESGKIGTPAVATVGGFDAEGMGVASVFRQGSGGFLVQEADFVFSPSFAVNSNRNNAVVGYGPPGGATQCRDVFLLVLFVGDRMKNAVCLRDQSFARIWGLPTGVICGS